jgi:endonuclease YncB( thermonuclease family)
MRPLRIAAALLLFGCATAAPLPADRKADRRELQGRIGALEKPGLVVGVFPLSSKNPIVDGDTVRVQGLDNTLRLLGIDTEETFKHEPERRAYEAGWEQYLKDQRGSSLHPVKMATPLGMDAKKFCEQFFDGVKEVRLERDHPKEVRDYYNRYLAYVLVERDGKWLNYNIEAVRAGMSPYFTKYGYSRRFHDDFLAAEAEAMAAKRGIWDPAKQHYPDYPERKTWWNGRAEFIKAFEVEAAERDNYIELTNIDTPDRLEKTVGKEVILLGSISEVKLGDKGPTLAMLGRRRGNDFPLIFFDKDVFTASHVADHVGEYVRVKGFVSKYEDQKRGKYELQVKIDLPSQIIVPQEAAHAQAR